MKQLLSDHWHLISPESISTPVAVPGCWEAAGYPKNTAGPFVYERVLNVPEGYAGHNLWLRFEGVSYHAQVFIDDYFVGEHKGIWDAFEFDVSTLLVAGQTHTLSVKVEKPASLKQGPASEALTGHFPLKETLSGFLPYVWGHMFGGIWQNVWLEARAATSLENFVIHTNANGQFQATATLTQTAECSLRITTSDAQQTIVTVTANTQGHTARFSGVAPDVLAWCPQRPVRYKAQICVHDEVIYETYIGFRSLDIRGSDLYLNNTIIYPRMALSWGWYLNSLHSNPGPQRVRADFLKLKELGYNGVKFCLWVPPAYVFDLADELGMFIWLELPMWLPEVTPFFKEQTFKEYARIVEQVQRHPSILIYSLGCELNADVGESILEPLYKQTKALVGDALLRDNSGSGEAYGGLLNEFADYYDYHFYSDIQFFEELLHYFTPRTRAVQPWVFGEFCDLDTVRDLRKLRAAYSKEHLWWLSADPTINPQGSRWQYDLPFHEERLRANGFWERQHELEIISNKQAFLHRKFTIELVRSFKEISGYVITGEQDTPISSSGMWDELGAFKFDTNAFAAFNRDVTLLLGWDKRRAWLQGGDRAAYWDTYAYTASATVRPHVIASNYGATLSNASLSWQVHADTHNLIAQGEASVTIAAGDVRELTVAEFQMPDVTTPQTIRFQATLSYQTDQTSNTWTLWCFPQNPWQSVDAFSVFDPLNTLQDLEKLTAVQPFTPSSSGVVIATLWTPEVNAFIQAGGNAIVLLSGYANEPVDTLPLPFWREGVKVIEAHPAWQAFPHEHFTDLQFYGMATDRAMDTFARPDTTPILRRVDARTMQVHDYATELTIGQGRAILSTLKFAGGLGNQPVGISRNTAASYLLSCWLRYLQT